MSGGNASRTRGADLDNCLDDMLAAYEWLASLRADDSADWPFLLSGGVPNTRTWRGVSEALQAIGRTRFLAGALAAGIPMAEQYLGNPAVDWYAAARQWDAEQGGGPHA